MFCSLQTAIEALNRWKTDGTFVGILFFRNAGSMFLNFSVQSFEVAYGSLAVYGPYDSGLSVKLPESPGCLEYGVPDDIESSPDDSVTYRSFVTSLRAKQVTCLQIWSEAGCFVLYEVLGAMDAVATVQ